MVSGGLARRGAGWREKGTFCFSASFLGHPRGQRGPCGGKAECPLFLRDRSACVVDVQTRAKHYLRNIRSGCGNSLIAADGILSVPLYATGCVCNYPVQASVALVHMPEVADWAGTTPLKLD